VNWFLYFFDVHEVVVAALAQKLLEDVVSQVGLFLLHHFDAFVLERDILLIHIHLLYYAPHLKQLPPRIVTTKHHSLLLVLAHRVHLEAQIVSLLGVQAHRPHQGLRHAHDGVDRIDRIH